DFTPDGRDARPYHRISRRYLECGDLSPLSTTAKAATGRRTPNFDLRMTFLSTWRQQDFAAIAATIVDRTAADVRRALDRAPAALTLDDLAALLSPAAAPFLEEMAGRSHRLTVARFGRTMQLYAPMYLTNVCANVCTYCGFSAQNRIPRKALDDAEILAEADVLVRHGFEHVLLVTGESSRYGVAYFQNALRLLRPRVANVS